MKHLPIRKALLLVSLLALTIIFGLGLWMSKPATARATEATLDPAPDHASSPPPASEIQYEFLSPAERQSEPGTGYLTVHVYDNRSRRALDGRVVTIYDDVGTQVTQETTTCPGYVEFTDLPTGHYRVVLEADAEWVTARQSNFPGGRNTTFDWVYVRPTWRVAVRFYEEPNLTGAGLRVEAYAASSRQAGQAREPLAGAAFTIYDAAGDFVANGTTACNGFVDFNNLSAGDYRVVDVNEGAGPSGYPPAGERWVSLRNDYTTRVWFFTVASPGPQTTPTPAP